MMPRLRYTLGVAIGMLVVGLAAPKVLPLLGAAAGPKGQATSPERKQCTPGPPDQGIHICRATRAAFRDHHVDRHAARRRSRGAAGRDHRQDRLHQLSRRRAVRSGELLVKLNDADLRATLSARKYRKQLAVLRERRIAQLLKQGVARQEEYDTALDELNVQDAEIELTRAQIAKTEIRAPFDGIVGLRYVSDGAFVNAATRVATLQRLDRLKIDFAVAGEIRRPHQDRQSDHLHRRGTRRPVSRARSTRSIRASTPRRAPCSCARATRIPTRGYCRAHSRVSNWCSTSSTTPSWCRRWRSIAGLNEMNVFVVVEGKAERRAVGTGTRTATTVHMLSGLQPGDECITSGCSRCEAAVLVDNERHPPAGNRGSEAEQPSIRAGRSTPVLTTSLTERT